MNRRQQPSICPRRSGRRAPSRQGPLRSCRSPTIRRPRCPIRRTPRPPSARPLRCDLPEQAGSSDARRSRRCARVGTRAHTGAGTAPATPDAARCTSVPDESCRWLPSVAVTRASAAGFWRSIGAGKSGIASSVRSGVAAPIDRFVGIELTADDALRCARRRPSAPNAPFLRSRNASKVS